MSMRIFVPTVLMLGVLGVGVIPALEAQEAAIFDGGFESGVDAPMGWQISEDARGQWREGGARSGAKCIQAASNAARAAWTSAPMPVDASKPCVADAWIQPASGAGWLGARYLDAGGKVVAEAQSPRVSAISQWGYTAIDLPVLKGAAADAAQSIQLAFWVEGDAAMDDAALRPLLYEGVMNGDFETPLDKKGRISFWNAEEDATLLPGVRDGRFEAGAPAPDGGTGALKLIASGDWFAFTSIHYPVWRWTDNVMLSADLQSDADTRLGLVWVDSAQAVLRVDYGEPIASAPGWRHVEAGPFSPPEGADGIRPLLVVLKQPGAATEAAAQFDNVALHPTERHEIRVTANQAGYETAGAKRATILTNFFPEDIGAATFEVLTADGATTASGTLECRGRMAGEKGADWRWYFWDADFSTVAEPGDYRIRVMAGADNAESPPFPIGKDVLFQETAQANVDFFFVQRCGFEVPGWHAACHLDCAKLPDGTHRDLNGGWHSAGDYNKLNWEYGDGGVAYALVNAYESAPDFFQQFDRDGAGLCDALDEAWWGAKFLAKVQVPETGGILNHIEQGPDRKTWMNWCPPEKTTDNLVGTADDPKVIEGNGSSPLAIGAWARLSRLLKEQGIENSYLDNAQRMWKHDTKDGTTAASPLLLISSIDLYGVTNEEAVLDYARRGVEALLATGTPGGQLSGGYGESGDIPAAALARFAIAFPGDPLAPKIKARLIEHTPGFLSASDNALGLMMQKPGKDGHFFEPTSTMGCNYQFFSRAWSALLSYRVTGDPRLVEHAMNQIDFVLGRNPYGLCMMEGEGTVNLPRYHHRYNTIPGHERGAVPGTIPNGFVRDIAGNDRPGADMSTGGRPYPSYRTNEPWLIHNVFYTMAVTALHEVVGASRE